MTLPTIATPQYSLVQPSTGKQISYRPFLVKEEKILLIAAESNETSEFIHAIKQVIASCCTGLDNIDQLPLFDLEYIFLQLRAKSMGEMSEPMISCPQCDQPIKLKIDVSKVKVTKPKDHSLDIRLSEEVGVKMRYPSFELFSSSLLGEDWTVEQAFNAIIGCIDVIYDKDQQHKVSENTRENVAAFVDNLPQECFAKLQGFFDTMPRLEHTVSYTCKNKVPDNESVTCGHSGKIVLSGVNDFFA